MLPTFLIAGVEKSGSTSLYHYLRQHPDVFMPNQKEPNFFIDGGSIQTLDDYEALFDGASGAVARGEASVGYMNDPSSAARIAAVLPDAQILIVLRDPAARAYSHYNMLVEHGVLPSRPYSEVLQQAEERADFAFTGLPTSRYAKGLRAFQEAFGENVHVHFFDELKADPLATVRAIYTQIGVDPSFTPDLTQTYNRTHRPKSSVLQRLMRRSNPVKSVLRTLIPETYRSRLRDSLTEVNKSPVPPLDPESRARLTRLLRDDIEETEAILGRSLDAWKR